MNFGKSCKFYENSRCILLGNYCDLSCNRFVSDEDSQFYDKIDVFTRWRMEEVEKETGSSGWKLR
jgi:hypothetical protein